MSIFLVFLVALLCGYKFYGSFVERIFEPNSENQTPAYKYRDDVDYIPLPKYKIFLIQFLNIAGLGPVYGPILGAVYGPACLFWILIGSIFLGATHDYFSGMMSVRYEGKSPNYIVEKLFGNKAKVVFLFFLVVLLVLVGTVFATAPATMLANMTKDIKVFNLTPFAFWISLIFMYYFLSTYLPIDKIIAKLYPFFGLILIIVTVGLGISIFTHGDALYNLSFFKNLHPLNEAMFPTLFITVACGAISGFHATQSPLMARCLKNEKDGKQIFYGAMITEGVIALIWACVGICFYQNTQNLQNGLSLGGPAAVVSKIANAYLGTVGGILAVLAVVFLSITSGDTAFRSARLTISDGLKLSQKKNLNRFVLSSVVLGIGIFLSQIDIRELWKYFGWANQTLGATMLWIITIYLSKQQKNYFITLIPALFMTSVCAAYILSAPIGLKLSVENAIYISIGMCLVLLALFYITCNKKHK